MEQYEYTWYPSFLPVLNKNVLHRNAKIRSTNFALMLRHRWTDIMFIYCIFVYFAKIFWNLKVIFDIICGSVRNSNRGRSFCIETSIRDRWCGFQNQVAVRDFPLLRIDETRSCPNLVSQCIMGVVSVG